MLPSFVATAPRSMTSAAARVGSPLQFLSTCRGPRADESILQHVQQLWHPLAVHWRSPWIPAMEVQMICGHPVLVPVHGPRFSFWPQHLPVLLHGRLGPLHIRSPLQQLPQQLDFAHEQVQCCWYCGDWESTPAEHGAFVASEVIQVSPVGPVGQGVPQLLRVPTTSCPMISRACPGHQPTTKTTTITTKVPHLASSPPNVGEAERVLQYVKHPFLRS